MSEMMHEHEMALRQMLRAAADQVEPADGLDRIRERVSHRRPRPLLMAWAQVAWTRLSLRVPDGAWAGGRKAARDLQTACERLLPAAWRSDPDRTSRSRLSWLRPTLAMGTAVFIVAAVVYMAIKVPQVVTPAGNGSRTVAGGTPGHPRSGTAPGQSLTHGGSTPTGNGQHTTGGKNASTCPPSKTPVPIFSKPPASSPTSTPLPSITPTPTSTPTPTGTPTPTPTDSDSTSPAGSGTSPTDNQSAPSTDPGAGKTSQRLAASITDGHSSATPCPSATRKRTSSRIVRPQTAHATLTVWISNAALVPADVRDRSS
jgi:hypothetical protein